MRLRAAAAAGTLVTGLLAVGVGGLFTPSYAGSATRMSGTFVLTAGSCSGGKVSGSYFRMILPSGGHNGPYLNNNDSACGTKSYTLLSPGTDGGLVTGTYQKEPSPAFDGSGNSRAARIIKPVRFYGVDFSASTNAVDPQTKASVPPPTVTASASGSLSGDLRSFAASWNNQEFNQGAPKPNGSTPGNTQLPSGSYDAATGAFTLQWESQIVGGPFSNFTGQWHLVGHFSRGTTPAPSATPTPAPAPSTAGHPTAPGATATSSPSSATAVAAGTPSGKAGGKAGGASTSGSPSAALTSSSAASATPTAGGSTPPAGPSTAAARPSSHAGSSRTAWVVVAAVLAALSAAALLGGVRLRRGAPS